MSLKWHLGCSFQSSLVPVLSEAITKLRIVIANGNNEVVLGRTRLETREVLIQTWLCQPLAEESQFLIL